jgi:microcompartment protein CcmL/EutN
MPVSDLHRQVAAVALAAAAGYGFALGGGNALLAHGVISRPTQDVDLFTDQEHGVQAAGVWRGELRADPDCPAALGVTAWPGVTAPG